MPRLISDDKFRHSNDSRNPTATVKDTVLPLVTEGLMNRGISIDLFVSTGAENADAAIAFFYSIAHDLSTAIAPD